MAVMYFFTLLILLGPNAIGGQSDDCQNGVPQYTGVNEKDREVILDVHNRLRDQVASGKLASFPSASNIQKMNWDDNLARAAQAHANYCKMEHFEPKPETFASNYGQNLYMEWSTAKFSSNWTKAIQDWFSEFTLYSPGFISSFNFSVESAHFTQVIWSNSARIGCGYTAFTDNRTQAGFTDVNTAIYTCNYLEHGNIIDGEVYASGQPCSNCTCDTTYKNLCK